MTDKAKAKKSFGGMMPGLISVKTKRHDGPAEGGGVAGGGGGRGGSSNGRVPLPPTLGQLAGVDSGGGGAGGHDGRTTGGGGASKAKIKRRSIDLPQAQMSASDRMLLGRGVGNPNDTTEVDRSSSSRQHGGGHILAKPLGKLRGRSRSDTLDGSDRSNAKGGGGNVGASRLRSLGKLAKGRSRSKDAMAAVNADLVAMGSMEEQQPPPAVRGGGGPRCIPPVDSSNLNSSNHSANSRDLAGGADGGARRRSTSHIEELQSLEEELSRMQQRHGAPRPPQSAGNQQQHHQQFKQPPPPPRPQSRQQHAAQRRRSDQDSHYFNQSDTLLFSQSGGHPMGPLNTSAPHFNASMPQLESPTPRKLKKDKKEKKGSKSLRHLEGGGRQQPKQQKQQLRRHSTSGELGLGPPPPFERSDSPMPVVTRKGRQMSKHQEVKDKELGGEKGGGAASQKEKDKKKKKSTDIDTEISRYDLPQHPPLKWDGKIHGIRCRSVDIDSASERMPPSPFSESADSPYLLGEAHTVHLEGRGRQVQVHQGQGQQENARSRSVGMEELLGIDMQPPFGRADSPMPSSVQTTEPKSAGTGPGPGSQLVDDLMNIYSSYGGGGGGGGGGGVGGGGGGGSDMTTEKQSPQVASMKQPGNSQGGGRHGSKAASDIDPRPAMRGRTMSPSRKREPRRRSPHPVRGFADPSLAKKPPQQQDIQLPKKKSQYEPRNSGGRATSDNDSPPSRQNSDPPEEGGRRQKASSSAGGNVDKGNATPVRPKGNGNSQPSQGVHANAGPSLDKLNMPSANNKDGSRQDDFPMKFSSDMSVDTLDSLDAQKLQTSEQLRELIEMMQAEFQKLRGAKVSAEMRATTLETDLVSSQQEMDAEFVKMSEEKERWKRIAHQEKVRYESACVKVESLEREREKMKVEWGRIASDKRGVDERCDGLEKENKRLRKLLKARLRGKGGSSRSTDENGSSTTGLDTSGHDTSIASFGSSSNAASARRVAGSPRRYSTPPPEASFESILEAANSGNPTDHRQQQRRRLGGQHHPRQQQQAPLRHPQSVHVRGSRVDRHLYPDEVPRSWHAGKKKSILKMPVVVPPLNGGNARPSTPTAISSPGATLPAKASRGGPSVLRSAKLRRKSSLSTTSTAWSSTLTLKDSMVSTGEAEAAGGNADAGRGDDDAGEGNIGGVTRSSWQGAEISTADAKEYDAEWDRAEEEDGDGMDDSTRSGPI